MKILIVDDHTLFRQGILALLKEDSDINEIHQASSAEEALDVARRVHPDVVVMDVRLPGMSGLEAAQALNRELPTARIVMLTVSGREEDVYEAIRSGARAYLLKSATADELMTAIRAASKGNAYISPALTPLLMNAVSNRDPNGAFRPTRLTARERETVRLVAQGRTNAEIAKCLRVSTHTVKVYVRSVLRKLGLRNRAQLAVYAAERGLVNDQ